MRKYGEEVEQRDARLGFARRGFDERCRLLNANDFCAVAMVLCRTAVLFVDGGLGFDCLLCCGLVVAGQRSSKQPISFVWCVPFTKQ